MSLMKMLKNHDWFYGYSDDHRYWTAGVESEKKIKSRLSETNCPYSMKQLRMAVNDMILENFAEETPGEWYRQPRKYKSIAPVYRSDLIFKADQVQILAWIEAQK